MRLLSQPLQAGSLRSVQTLCYSVSSVANLSEKSIYAICGPTASGKSELGIELALKLGNGEIINCDSVQIYKEIEIATAKIPLDERRGILHHLIDYVPPKINYTAADWAKDACEKIIEIESRGNVPILVGGTGFYLRTLRNPFFEGPKTDETLRNRLKSILEKRGVEHMHKMLNRVDPERAAQVMQRDYSRTLRALEVYFQTGERHSQTMINRAEPPEFANRIKIFVLSPPREKLYKLINRRAEFHFENGLVEEVKALREKGLKDDTNALGAHGYRRVCEYLRGERTRESAIEQTKQDVRNYAKRQLTWFRREEGAVWLDGFGNDPEIQYKLWQKLELA